MPAFASLRENKEFRTLYYHGRSRVHPALVTYMRKNRLGYPRVGITTGKKLGGAVQRSRARRVIRAAFQPLCARTGSVDIVFVARGRLLSMKSTELAPVMEKQLAELGALTHG